ARATAPGALPSAAIPASPGVVMAPSPPPPSAPVGPTAATRSPAQVSVVPVAPGGSSDDGERYLSIQFAPGQAELSSEWRQLLAGQAASINAVLAQRPTTTLVVVGNADAASDGSRAEAVAARRAGVVRESLATMAVPSARLLVRTRGTRDPQFKGAESARNRRVDLFLFDAAKAVVAPKP
ncbi:MAG TPA: OmpA family protein, partial [Nevskiaceae bacterium]|nr:OmpA family protein [Nevskiaceae bacterium]